MLSIVSVFRSEVLFPPYMRLNNDQPLTQKAMTESSPPSVTQSHADTQSASTAQSHIQTASPEVEMVLKLKIAIDDRGRYAYRLKDMAAGYAAASGINRFEAQLEIERKFESTVGCSPKQYLDQHYNMMRGQRNGASRGAGM